MLDDLHKGLLVVIFCLALLIICLVALLALEMRDDRVARRTIEENDVEKEQSGCSESFSKTHHTGRPTDLEKEQCRTLECLQALGTLLGPLAFPDDTAPTMGTNPQLIGNGYGENRDEAQISQGTVTKTYRVKGGPFLMANHYHTADQQEKIYNLVSELDTDPAGPLIRETTSFWRFFIEQTGITNYVLVTKISSEKQQKELEEKEDQFREEWETSRMLEESSFGRNREESKGAVEKIMSVLDTDLSGETRQS